MSDSTRAVTFCAAVVMKVMDQKTLVKRRWSYKVTNVRITVYILTPSEFARHEVTNLWLETLPDTLSLSLTGIRLGPKQARRVNVQRLAYTSLAERWTITEIRRTSNSVLTYSLLTDVLPLYKFKIRLDWASVKKLSNVLSISKAYFPQIKWTKRKKWNRNSEKFNF